MSISKQDGNVFLLKGPSKDKGNIWDLSLLKYINFENYGKSTKINISKKVVEKAKEIIPELKKEILNLDIKPDIIDTDNYLEEKETKTIKHNLQKEISSIELISSSELINPGSPVLYYSTQKNKQLDEKIYAQIQHSSELTCIFEFNINQWQEKINQNPQDGDLIYCEWDASWWKIISALKINNQILRIITEKYNK